MMPRDLPHVAGLISPYLYPQELTDAACLSGIVLTHHGESLDTVAW